MYVSVAIRTKLLAAAVLVAAPGLSFAGALCGPGNHWVDTCAGGVYNFNSVSTIAVVLDTNSTLGLDPGDTAVPFLQLTGTTSVFLGVGSPNTHDIVTELASLNESGSIGSTAVHLTAGDGVPNLANDGPLFSPGRITEQAANPALADSFFDVFFQVDVPDLGLSLRNFSPLRVRCEGLTQAPPTLCAYTITDTSFPVPLFDVTGNVRGALLETPPNFAHHVVTPATIPEPGTWMLLAGALAALVLRKSGR